MVREVPRMKTIGTLWVLGEMVVAAITVIVFIALMVLGTIELFQKLRKRFWSR
jgi:hypothetical protein